MKGALTSLMEHRTVPKKTLTCLEGPWGHRAIQKSCVYPNSTRDKAAFSCIGSRAILHSPGNMTSGLRSFRQLQKFRKNPVKCPEELEIQHSNSRKALCTTKSLRKIDYYLTLTQQECQLSTSTSIGRLSHLYVCA